MYRDYIKHIVKTLGVTLLCALALGFIVYFAFGESRKPEAVPESQSQPVVTAPHNPDTAHEKFQEGKHYQKLSAKITTQPTIQQFVATDPGKIQVIEFFNYACFWCQRLHPKVNEWAATKPPQVVLYHFPIVFNKGWEVMAKAYFMVKTLGQNDSLDEKFFHAIHTDNQDLADEKLLQAFFAQQGVDQAKFRELYDSFAVNRAVAQSNDLANAYELTVSPAIIINGPTGSYLVTASMAGNIDSVLEIVSFLLDKETKALAQK